MLGSTKVDIRSYANGCGGVTNIDCYQQPEQQKEPAFFQAVRAFKSPPSSNNKMKFQGNSTPTGFQGNSTGLQGIPARPLHNTQSRNVVLERELQELQVKMDSKMTQLQEKGASQDVNIKNQDLQDLAEKTKPAAHILETVMGELEQRNLELSSLLKASEKSRIDMEQLLREQNEELTTLRANTLIMRTLEDEVTTLSNKKNDLQENIEQLEGTITECKKQEQAYTHRIHDMEVDRERTEQEHNSAILDLDTKLNYAESQLHEKDDVIQRTEETIKDLFEKCNQLGTNNTDIKNELVHCLESGKNLKDINTKLQFCKDYLEGQVDELIKEVKTSKASNEQLKLEMSNMSREKQNCNKQVMLLEHQCSQMGGEIQMMRDKYLNSQKQLQDYESGELRSAATISELAKEREIHSATLLELDKKKREFESDRKLQDEELKNAMLYGKKMKAEMMQLQAKIIFYQENYVEKQELDRIKNDMELKFKLDLNTQLQNVSAMFEKEQAELIETMRNSLIHRGESGDLRNARTYRKYL